MRTRQSMAIHHREGADEANVNLTPLLDVVFVVLIMFIVVVPILELDRVMLACGKQSHAQPKNVKESSQVAIHVKQNNSIWVGKQEMTIGQLQEWLVLKHQQNPHAVPQLFHDRQAQFGTYQKVKNALESAGYESMDVILNSQ